MQQLLFFLVFWATVAAGLHRCRDDTYAYFQGWCYRYNETLEANYEQAVASCRNTGDELVSIHNAFVNAFLSSTSLPGGTERLIGYRYYPDVDEYRWSDGTPIDYTNYDDNYVAHRDDWGYCTRFSGRYWTNARCETSALPFVCQHEAIEESPTTECPVASAINNDSGTLYSPGYPDRYDLPIENSDCEYLVAAPSYSLIKITFDEIDLGGDVGQINIYENWNDDTEVVQADDPYTGKSMIIPYSSFKIKMINTVSGRWRITWQGLTEDETVTPSNKCPDPNLIYYSPDGKENFILSPGYPNDFDLPTGWECSYRIAFKKGYSMELYFQELVLEKDSCCCYILDNWEQIDQHQISSYVDTAGPGDFIGLSEVFGRIAIQFQNVTRGTYKIGFGPVKDDD